jgi:hypothetical protein
MKRCKHINYTHRVTSHNPVTVRKICQECQKDLGPAPACENVRGEQYAFWAYSSFPFVLGGLITNQHGGNVSVKGYGADAWIRPALIMPACQGAPIKEKLEILENQHRAALHSLNKLFKSLVDAVIKLPPKAP